VTDQNHRLILPLSPRRGERKCSRFPLPCGEASFPYHHRLVWRFSYTKLVMTLWGFMKHFITNVIALLLLPSFFGLTACAPLWESSLQYNGPIPGEQIVAERVIAKPFNGTWSTLVGNLAKSPFVIKDLDKASGFIDLAFSTDEPQGYVDCGRAKRKYLYKQESRSYEYAVAGSADYRFMGSGGYGILNVASILRRASLDGRASIYVDPRGAKETMLTTNIHYVWTIRIYGTEEYMNSAGTVIRKTLNREIDKGTISFNTNQVGTDDVTFNVINNKSDMYEKASIKCRSTGLLESQVLGLAGN